LWDLPLVRTPKLDSLEYVSWARRIAAGDFSWPVVSPHGPGYPLFLAVLLTVGAGSLKVAIALQAVMGAATAALVAMTARDWFGSRAGLFAGLVYALYGPAVYIDTALLAEGLLLLLLVLALAMLARDPVVPVRAAAAGAALGAAALVRPTALVIAVACLAWLLMPIVRGVRFQTDRQAARARALASAAMFTAVGILVMSPALVKSWSAARTLAIQGYGGMNVYIGNSPLHDGRATFRLGGGWDALNAEASRAGITDPAAQDWYYVSKTLHEIAQQPFGFVKLLARKTLWTIQAEESRDSHSYYFFTEQSPVLRVLPRMAVLFPLACIGLFVIVVVRLKPDTTFEGTSTTDGEALTRAGLLALYAIAAAASTVLLVVGLRYRMPLVPALAVAAGVGLTAIADAAFARRTRELTMCAGIAVAAIVVSHLLTDPRNRNVAEEWAFTGGSLITERDQAGAEAAYRRATALDPESSLAWDGLGLAQYNANRLRNARQSLLKATARNPENAHALFHLALVDERDGRAAAAIDGYRKAFELSPDDVDIARHLATALGMVGRSAEGRDVMQRVVQMTPGDGEAWLDLALLALDAHDVDRAAAALARAREFGADAERLKFTADALDGARATRR
jgi:Flp pilus assembly protein TadD